MAWVSLLLVVTLAAGYPPLDQMQQRQLEAANDGTTYDEGAIVPLLRNAMQWDEPLRAAGTTVPDYQAIETKPDQHRGQLFTIEGDFLRRRRVPVSRSGPWGNKVTEWAIRVSDKPDPRYVIVFFADPNNNLPHPQMNTPVKTVARFYKIYGAPNKKRSRLIKTPAFVGRAATVTGSGNSSYSVGMTDVLAMLVAIVVLAFGYITWRVRQTRPAGQGAPGFSLFKKKPIEPKRLRHHVEDEVDEAEETELDEGPPLPSQSDEALAELSRRHADDEPEPTGETRDQP